MFGADWGIAATPFVPSGGGAARGLLSLFSLGFLSPGGQLKRFLTVINSSHLFSLLLPFQNSDKTHFQLINSRDAEE